MGLDVVAKGMPRFSLSYSTYYRFRAEIIKAVYGEKCYKIFTIPPFERSKMKYSEEQAYIDYWNSVCSNDLDMFLLHSDYDGHFTPKECRTILKALEPIDIDMPGWDFDRKPCKMIDQWKRMFEHCAKRRVCMWYY